MFYWQLLRTAILLHCDMHHVIKRFPPPLPSSMSNTVKTESVQRHVCFPRINIKLPFTASVMKTSAVQTAHYPSSSWRYSRQWGKKKINWINPLEQKHFLNSSHTVLLQLHLLKRPQLIITETITHSGVYIYKHIIHALMTVEWNIC